MDLLNIEGSTSQLRLLLVLLLLFVAMCVLQAARLLGNGQSQQPGVSTSPPAESGGGPGNKGPVGGTGAVVGSAAGSASGGAPVPVPPVPGLGYTISGKVSGLHPTGSATPIDVTFDNPNHGNGGTGVNGVRLATLTVAITTINTPNRSASRPCGTSDFVVLPYSGAPFYIPQGSSSLSTLIPPIPPDRWPSIRLIDAPTANQDGCKGATVTLSYTGAP